MSILNRPASQLVGAGLLLAAVAFRLPPEDSLARRIVKSLGVYYATALPEKAYLHLDRSYYAGGETVWFRAYVVEADSHRPDTLSKVLYVDLLSAQRRVVLQRTLRLQGGLASGDLALPDTLAAGTYQLRAYTSWMRNAGPDFFFTHSLAVLRATGPAQASEAAGPTTPDVHFFPEGGNLVVGLESEVGFKAVDGRGHGVAIQGTVLDDRGHAVARFSSQHLGMGSFQLTPAEGQQYRAVLALPGGSTAEVPLPIAQPAGYGLHVSETADEFVVRLQRRLPAGSAPAGPALLLAQVRGKVVYAAQAPFNSPGAVVARLPKAAFPAGLAHITLFDELGTAQCERLVFVPNPAGVRLTLSPDKATYGPHEAVRLRLQATNATGQPVAGQFSVAVTAHGATPDDAPTILSHLLLTSDLAGPVEAPGYYFREPQTPEIRQALNYLLLTQGWRRFVWKELLAGQQPGHEFALEQGLRVSGQVLLANGQPAPAHTVAYLQSNPNREAQMLTDATGRFLFRGLDGQDTAHVMLRVQPGRHEQGLRIRMLGAPPANAAGAGLPAAPPAEQADYLHRSQQHQLLEQRIRLLAGGPVQLGGVHVRGSRPLPPADNVERAYSTGSATVLQPGREVKQADSRTALDYLRGRVAGVVVSGKKINIRQAVTIQKQGNTINGVSQGGVGIIEPLFLLDGNIISSEIFADLPANSLQTIDVMNQSAATLFGTLAYGGVIAAYSRQNNLAEQPDPTTSFAAARVGAVSLQVPGYYQAREFYAPRYEATTPADQPDPRYTTLYWAPAVRTDTSGQAQLQFFTSGATGTFQATAEGLSPQGTALRGTAALEVRPSR